ncbi:MAG: hypothetical protein V5B44_26250 [Candidatus Accumulibacter necessarius]|uniref:hypothetical protein n=1 Tax=Candidatus Accumulibacter necessarius TaxID=2954386 RepID=UPI002FC29FB5
MPTRASLTLPSFLGFAIPLTRPWARHCSASRRLQEGQFLPNVRLRDMDGRSLVCHPEDAIEESP